MIEITDNELDAICTVLRSSRKQGYVELEANERIDAIGLEGRLLAEQSRRKELSELNFDDCESCKL